MALVVVFDLETQKYKAGNAFSNSSIHDQTHCKPPKGQSGLYLITWLLLKALYVPKQSPALWSKYPSCTVIKLELESVLGVKYLFGNEHLILIFFIDDIVVLHQIKDTNKVEECQTKQFTVYKICYIGSLESFLNIQVVQDQTSPLWPCLSLYIDKIIAKYNISLKSKHPGVLLPPEELVKLLK